jgi:signal transduction histidine kinase
MRYSSLPSLKGKIIVRLGILITIEVLLVVISFGITTYIQSQSTDIGNTINIAGRNRYLTSNFLLQFEKVNDGTAQIESLRNALDELAANILVLKSGGEITSASGKIFLMPLSAKYLDKWNEINEKAIALDRYVKSLEQIDAGRMIPSANSNTYEAQLFSLSTTSTEFLNSKTAVETTASQLIASSDSLTHQLGNDARTNSQNLVTMQTTLLIGIVVVSGIVLYVMKRFLRPISSIIEATKEVKKGNFSMPPIKHRQGNDEISILTSSFNSMIVQLSRYDQMQKHFISIASHELRSPLQPILGLSDALRRCIMNNSEAYKFADAIFRNAKKLQNTTENVLQATKIENQLLSLNKEKLNISELIRPLVEDAKDQIKVSDKNIQLLLLSDKTGTDGKRFVGKGASTDKVVLNVDRTRLCQVFTNLLNNAIKFTIEGVISISMKEQIDSKSMTDNRYVVISVKDTGIGINPAIFPRLFTKFGTRSETGTGLGLYISKSIVEAHGGKIWAENNPDGKGATFTFTLPFADGAIPYNNPNS